MEVGNSVTIIPKNNNYKESFYQTEASSKALHDID